MEGRVTYDPVVTRIESHDLRADAVQADDVFGFGKARGFSATTWTIR
jgi:hypothetical protein